MKHGDARMLLTVQDPVARDNFQRLNRLFANGEFAMGYGNLTLNVQHLGGLQTLIHWQRLGRLITLSMDADLNPASVDGTNPVCSAGLPVFLRPRSPQIFIVPTENNSAVAASRLVVNTDGTLEWQLVPGGGAWTSVVRIYATSVSYLGV